VRSQDGDRVVELFQRLERVCGNAEDGGQYRRRKLTYGLAYPDVVFVFSSAGALNDQHVQAFLAAVLEVVEGTLACEHNVVDVGVETFVVAVPDEGQAATPLVTMLSSRALGCQCGSRIAPGTKVSNTTLAACPFSIGKLSSSAC